MKSAARFWAKRWLGPNLRFNVRVQANQLRSHGAIWFCRWNAMCAHAWVRDRVNRHRYDHLTEGEARARRKSDTVFIFGSGSSLNDLSDHEWAHFASHDVLGFNAFYYQRRIPVGFHLLRSGVYGELRWKPFAWDVAGLLRDNPCFHDTVFVMQEEYVAHFNNQMVGYGLLPPTAKVLRYRTARGDGPPTGSVTAGLRHQGGTLADAVNCAFCLGWTQIVLVGVDLYDSRYFYLPSDQTSALDSALALVTGAEFGSYRSNRFDDMHPTIRNGIVAVMADWCRRMAAEGVRLSVYNPRSLLAAVMPLYAAYERQEPVSR